MKAPCNNVEEPQTHSQTMDCPGALVRASRSSSLSAETSKERTAQTFLGLRALGASEHIGLRKLLWSFAGLTCRSTFAFPVAEG